jgi:predicted CoA-binding protein
MPLTTDAEIDELLRSAKTIAIVGASDRPDRASYGVMKFVQDRGYRTIPVNPRITGEHVHGEYIWRELGQIGEPIDIVDIFRKSEDVGPVIDEAIAAGAKAVWMQLGIRNAEAAAKAEAAGLKVVEDKCLKIELARGNTRVG